MRASILDLRYRMKDVLSALDRGETVIVLHRGKERAKLEPITDAKRGLRESEPKMEDQPFFGMWKDREDMADPAAYVRRVRQPRQAQRNAAPDSASRR